MSARWFVLGFVVTCLLVPALFLTTLRLLGPTTTGWVLFSAFTPYAVIPYTLALLLLLTTWFWGHGGWQTAGRAISVLTLACLALHLYWASGPFIGTAPTANGRPTIVVMTSNLRLGEADPAQVLSVAIKHNVDVLVLEEVTTQVIAGMDAAGLHQAFPYSIGTPGYGRVGLMVFSAHRLGEGDRLSTFTQGYQVPVHVDGRTVTLIAVHPIAPTTSVRDWASDQATIQAAAADQKGPTMVVGDFNASLDLKPLRGLTAEGYQDAATQAKSGWQPTWPSTGFHRMGFIPSLFALDHIFLRGGLQATHTESVTIDGTDHRSLLATVAL
ncbi:MAG: endonuclease/exonuclease/phosphatase family protein [Nocardioidaceae bacterium]